ncbi:hypothetical protein PENTCL1PPCAC_21944, partial [Pristionchus entomophagus]
SASFPQEPQTRPSQAAPLTVSSFWCSREHYYAPSKSGYSVIVCNFLLLNLWSLPIQQWKRRKENAESPFVHQLSRVFARCVCLLLSIRRPLCQFSKSDSSPQSGR